RSSGRGEERARDRWRGRPRAPSPRTASRRSAAGLWSPEPGPRGGGRVVATGRTVARFPDADAAAGRGTPGSGPAPPGGGDRGALQSTRPRLRSLPRGRTHAGAAPRASVIAAPVTRPGPPAGRP